MNTQRYAEAHERLLEIFLTRHAGMSYLSYLVPITQEPALSIHDLRHRNVLSEPCVHENITSTGLPAGIEHMLSTILVESVI